MYVYTSHVHIKPEKIVTGGTTNGYCEDNYQKLSDDHSQKAQATSNQYVLK